MKDNLKFTKSKLFLIAFNCLLCVAIIVSSMVIVIDKSRTKNGVVYKGDDVSTSEDTPQTAKSKAPNNTARLMLAGDNLIHRSVYEQARERTGGVTYDFSYAYENLKPILKNADIAFLNQESIIDTDKSPSSYPSFNTPAEILNTLSDVGFNVINQATNHCFDMGTDSYYNNIRLLKNSKIMMTGLYENKDLMLTPQIKQANGIKFSFIGITENVNEINALADSDASVICLNDTRYSPDTVYSNIKSMISASKKQSDVVCVAVHWSDEDITSPSDKQRAVVARLLEFGADIIIGSGTHSLQPIEFMKNCDEEQALVMWSLGNLITSQSKVNAMLGGIADVTVSKKDGKIKFNSVKLIPTVNHYEYSFGNVRIIPLASYTEGLLAVHGLKQDNEDFTLEYINTFYREMYKDNLEIIS